MIQTILQEFLLKHHADRNERNYAFYHICRYADTLKLVPETKARTLDIGVGFGHLAYLIKRLYGSEVVGLDVKDDYKMRLKREGIVFKKCDLTKSPIPFGDKSFDLVLFCETLEHLSSSYTDRIFREIERVLRKEGRLIVTTPNRFRVRRLLQWKMFSRFNPEHRREYAPSELTNLLTKNKFKIEGVIFSDCWSRAVRNRRADIGVMGPIFFTSSVLCKIVPLLKDCCMFRVQKF